MYSDKTAVKAFWERASCGEELYLPGRDRNGYERQARIRYDVEPYIPTFARFDEVRGQRVLEIGVGLGADHQRLAEAGAILDGIDLTEQAVVITRRRLKQFGLKSNVTMGDVESLPAPDGHFDLVHSWGCSITAPIPRARSPRSGAF